MIKDILGFALILIGFFTIGNFIAHHSGGIPVGDDNYHALGGMLMMIFGVFLIKAKVSIRDGWTKF